MVWLSVNPCTAETLRVTTWNLASNPGVSDTQAIREAASILGFLDPDVILLQDVHDWRECLDLAGALEPAKYTVVACSAFHGATADAPPQPQVAILSKRRAYLTRTDSWPEGLPGHGGLAFAAIETRTQRLGFFSCLLSDDSSGKSETRALVAAMDSVKHWQTNQVQTFVLAASAQAEVSDSTKLLRQAAARLASAGLVDATESMAPQANTITGDLLGRQPQTPYALFVGPQGFPMEPRILASAQFKNPPLTCEIELDPDKVSTALDIRSENRRESEVRRQATQTKFATVAVAVVGLGLFSGFVFRARSRKRARLRSRPVTSLPARVPAERTRPVVRPIIHVEAPRNATSSETTPKIQGPRPALRIQKPSPPVSTPLAPDVAGSVHPVTGTEPGQISSFDLGLESPESALADSLARVEPAVRRGVVRELAGWLKQKFVRKLLTDRQQMMQAQHLATRMATNLDSRLARIEAQIQVQNQAYLQRIEELNRELAAAREENRELIRERIAQVKAEMEAARAKMLAEANLNNTSLRL